MANRIAVHNTDELDKYKYTIGADLNSNINMLQQVINKNDALVTRRILLKSLIKLIHI